MGHGAPKASLVAPNALLHDLIHSQNRIHFSAVAFSGPIPKSWFDFKRVRRTDYLYTAELAHLTMKRIRGAALSNRSVAVTGHLLACSMEMEMAQ